MTRQNLSEAVVTGLVPDGDTVDMGFVFFGKMTGRSSTFGIPNTEMDKEDTHPARIRSKQLWGARGRK